MDTCRVVRIEEKLDKVLELLKGQIVLICPRCKASVRHEHAITLEQGLTTVLCPSCRDYFEVTVEPETMKVEPA